MLSYDPNSPDEAEVPLPNAAREPIVGFKGAGSLSLQPPLTRRGHGPGLIVFVPALDGKTRAETLDPEPVQKWAEGARTPSPRLLT